MNLFKELKETIGWRGIVFVLILGVFSFTSYSCTAQKRARQFGGSATIDLPENQELVTATWKGDEIWYLTRPRNPHEKPDTLWFKENSAFGIVEGEVIFCEH